ncbi:MAG TPA: hypothetical protein VFZ53_28275 [Polyangiaceae bacterium]
MSAELAKLLVRGGVPLAEVERALSEAVARRTNLPAALAATKPELLELVARELIRAEVPSLELVRPQTELVASLPDGMCERLGVLPVRRDPSSGRIDVAVLDPLDPHVARELEHHLDAPVRLLWARFDTFAAALQQSSASPRSPSGLPLPLVRRPPPSRNEADAAGYDPDAYAADDEPVLNLTRSKPRNTAPIPPPPFAPLLAPESPELPGVEASIEELGKAQNPDEVVTALVAALAPAKVLVLAVRGQAYEGRAGSPEFDARSVRRIRLAAGVPSVAETAVRQGYYFGTLPLTATHGAIREVLGSDAEGEVYVTQVSISARPSLVVLVTLGRALGGSVEGTRRVDELCRAAGRALETIVVSKKRGGVA